MPEIEIVDKPELKSPVRSTVERSFTAFMWFIWLYLILPLLSIGMWLFGFRSFIVEVIEKTGYLEFLNLLSNMGLSLLVIFVIFRLWGYFNYLRFGKKNRRRNVSSTKVEQLAQLFHIQPEQVKKLQSKKEVVWPLQVKKHDKVSSS